MGAPLQSSEGQARRLSPTMSSRKLIALDFIKRYFARWGHSPTLGEIAAELDVSPKRAHDLVHQLATEKMIEHTAGKARGIRLLERGEELSEADVLLRLSAMGWTIGRNGVVVMPPSAGHELAGALVRTLTEKELHSLPELDHVEEDQTGPAGTHGQTNEARHAHSRTAGAGRADGGEPGGLGAAAP